MDPKFSSSCPYVYEKDRKTLTGFRIDLSADENEVPAFFTADAGTYYSSNVPDFAISSIGPKKKKKMRFPLDSSYESTRAGGGTYREPTPTLVVGSLAVPFSDNGNEPLGKVDSVDLIKSGKVSSVVATGENRTRRSRSFRLNGKENGGLTWQRVREKSTEDSPRKSETKSTLQPSHSFRCVNGLQCTDNNSEVMSADFGKLAEYPTNDDRKPRGKSIERLLHTEHMKSTTKSGHSLKWDNVRKETDNISEGVEPVDFIKLTDVPPQNKDNESTRRPGYSFSGVNVAHPTLSNSHGISSMDFGKSTDEGSSQNNKVTSTESPGRCISKINVSVCRENKTQAGESVDFEKPTSDSTVGDVIISSSSAFEILRDSCLSKVDPIAEFEKLIGAASPVIMMTSIDSDYSDELPLADVWRWYEEVGAYGLGVRVEPSGNSKSRGDDKIPFNAYFVPSLSSVQLFSRAPVDAPDDCDILFEFFEQERPDLRKPICAKIKELAQGDTSDRQSLGDPTMLEGANLRHLHPTSWYSVAWYPIYRIPQGALRASFLTYHSLGHVAWRRRGSAGWHFVCPVLGMESYNAQGEGWFEGSPKAALNRRLAALGQAAEVLSRGTVSRGQAKVRNTHPDYEFFLSRK